MPFEFVNNTSIDRKARKLIRSHVAKGRNVGKKRQPRRRPAASTVKLASIYAQPSSSTLPGSENEQAIPVSEQRPVVQRQIGDGWSVLSFPDGIAADSRAVIHRAFLYLSGPHGHPGLHSIIDYAGAGHQMVAFMFVDEAYFHCAIAMCYKSLGPLSLGENNSSEAMRHISRSYRLINEKLSGKGALDDETMVAVLGMTHWERIQGRHRDSVTHLQGLLRIVDLRGGISSFAAEQPYLANKIFRADLEISLHLGSSTRYSLQDISNHAAESWFHLGFEDDNQNEARDIQYLGKANVSISEIFTNVTHFASFLNRGANAEAVKLAQHDFNNCLMMLGYRLIHVSSLNGPRPTNNLEDMLHFGLAAFLTSFLLEIGARPQGFPLLTHSTCTAIELHPEENRSYHETLLWTLFVGASSTFRSVDDRWLIARVTDTMISLDLDTWNDVLNTVTRLPWVHSVHDKPGQALWQKTRPSRCTDSNLPQHLLSS